MEHVTSGIAAKNKTGTGSGGGYIHNLKKTPAQSPPSATPPIKNSCLFDYYYLRRSSKSSSTHDALPACGAKNNGARHRRREKHDSSGQGITSGETSSGARTSRDAGQQPEESMCVYRTSHAAQNLHDTAPLLLPVAYKKRARDRARSRRRGRVHKRRRHMVKVA